MKHKHADLIHAWADGANIQFRESGAEWKDRKHPSWGERIEYRIKPEPPREPVRAWANVYIEGKVCVSDSQMVLGLDCVRAQVPLIEAGWCKMVEHDGSDQCPVDPDATVVYMNKMAKGWTKASNLTWRVITHYAVILPEEG